MAKRASQDSTNIQGDYGNSDYDGKHFQRSLLRRRFIFQPIGFRGWQVNSLIPLHESELFSVLSSSDNSGTTLAQRAGAA